MSRTLERNREMYGEYRFGGFSYRDERARFYPILVGALESCRPDQWVYDVGCGDGYWLRWSRERGLHRAVGIDLAPENVRQLTDAGFDARPGDVLELDLPAGCSDLTISNGVLHHTDDPERGFAELVRITKPGGRIYVSVYNVWHPYYWLLYLGTAPVRWLYWNVTRRVADVVHALASPFLKAALRLRTGQRPSAEDVRVHVMDQVFTPRVSPFSSRRLRRLFELHDVEVLRSGFVLGGLMRDALLEVGRS